MNDYAQTAATFLATHPYVALISAAALVLLAFSVLQVLGEALLNGIVQLWRVAARRWPRLARASWAREDAAVDLLLLALAEQNGMGIDGDGQWRTSRGLVLPVPLQRRAHRLCEVGYVEENVPAPDGSPIAGTVRVTDDGWDRLAAA